MMFRGFAAASAIDVSSRSHGRIRVAADSASTAPMPPWRKSRRLRWER
jgi:hypothetical protein